MSDSFVTHIGGYKHRLEEDYQIETDILFGKEAPEFDSFLKLEKDGTLTVSKVYYLGLRIFGESQASPEEIKKMYAPRKEMLERK